MAATSSTTYVSRKIVTGISSKVTDILKTNSLSFDKLMSSNNVGFDVYNSKAIEEYLSDKSALLVEINDLEKQLKLLRQSDQADAIKNKIKSLNSELERLKQSNTVGAIAVERYNQVNVSQYLKDCNSRNRPLCQGLNLVVTEVVPLSDGNSAQSSRKRSSARVSSRRKKNLYYLLNTSSQSRVNTLSSFGSISSATSDVQVVKPLAWFWRIIDGNYQSPAYLPVAPQEVTDTNNAEFGTETMMGRSVSYQLYESSSREIGFTLQLRADLVSKGVSSGTDHIYRIVSLIESCCYPDYNGTKPKPPEVAFQIAKQFFIRGVLKSCSASWSPPIIDGKYVNCNLSLSIVETTGPYGTLDITDSNYSGVRSFRDTGESQKWKAGF